MDRAKVYLTDQRSRSRPSATPSSCPCPEHFPLGCGGVGEGQRGKCPSPLPALRAGQAVQEGVGGRKQESFSQSCCCSLSAGQCSLSSLGLICWSSFSGSTFTCKVLMAVLGTVFLSLWLWQKSSSEHGRQVLYRKATSDAENLPGG